MGRGQKSHPRINGSSDKDALNHIRVLNNGWKSESIQEALGKAENGYFYATYPTAHRVDNSQALQRSLSKIAQNAGDPELKDALQWLGGFSSEAIEFLEGKNPGFAEAYRPVQQRAR